MAYNSLPPAYVARQEGNVVTGGCLSVHNGASPVSGPLSFPGMGVRYALLLSLVPHSDSTGGYPPLPPIFPTGERVMLCRRRYASYGHAGGLCCSKISCLTSAHEQKFCSYTPASGHLQRRTLDVLQHLKIHYKLMETSSCSDCNKYI